MKTDNDFRFERLNNDSWQDDPGRSNQFVDDENVNAAYVNMNKQYKSTSVQLGARIEQTSSKGNPITTPTLTGELNGSYTSLLEYSTLKLSAQYGVDLGLEKLFMNKKVNVKLAMSDMFNTYQSRTISSAYEGLNYSLVQELRRG